MAIVSRYKDFYRLGLSLSPGSVASSLTDLSHGVIEPGARAREGKKIV